MASLNYEFCENSNPKNLKSIVPYGTICTSIVFVFEGEIDVYYKENQQPLVNFGSGCYFGDISYIFKARNQFYYYPRPIEEGVHKEDYKLYSLRDHDLKDIFNKFPDFLNLMKIRALKR